jgi:hypothetical protein
MDATAGAPAYSAQNERQNMASLYGGGGGVTLAARSGFRVGTPSTILSATSTTWTLLPCSAVISPGAATAQGSYRWSADANVTGAVTAADATYTRKDIVYIQVNDSSSGDGSGALTAPVSYLAGTPASSPVAPTLPARSFLVGTITVPQTGGGSPSVVLNPAVFVAAGARLPIASVGERTLLTPYVGMEILRTDLTQVSASGVVERWNGSNWDHFGHVEFTSATNTAAQNTAWGMGVFTRDATPSTDAAFVTINATDKLQVRDAGLYSITQLIAFTTTISGISWASVDGSYTVNLGGGLQNFVATMPDVRLAAGALIQPLLSHGSGSDRTFTGRVRVTRVQ